MKQICCDLKEWGCSVSSALERCVEDEELYITCLYKFEKDRGFALLKKSLEQKDYEEAFSHAHTLKGVSGNLGIDRLTEKLNTIVAKLRGKSYDGLLEIYAELEEELYIFQGLLHQ